MNELSSISNDLRKLPLHDGSVNTLKFSEQENILIINIDPPEEGESALGKKGELIFFNVSILESTVELKTIHWDEIGADILTLQWNPQNDRENRYGVLLIIHLQYSEKEHIDTLDLKFLSSHFNWVAISAK